MNATMNAANTSVCEFGCGHPQHTGHPCPLCKCKGKKGFWRSMLDGLGDAIGESLFGGDRD